MDVGWINSNTGTFFLIDFAFAQVGVDIVYLKFVRPVLDVT